jgi:phenylalanyl-tRNA synthetase beta chain
MKINESWLRELVDPSMDSAAIGELLTMAGLELDGLEPAAPPFSGVVVARIEAIEQHPDADKLRICQVNTGESGLTQVICGAANAREGLAVAMATVGAVLPGDFRIRKAKLRGVESFGMLCSAAELGLADSSDGIMELPGDVEPGTDFRQWLNLDDVVFDIDLTPNRADCLSVKGVARELAVLTGDPLTLPGIEAVNTTIADTLPVDVAEASICPRYAGCVIKGVDVNAPTPVWMQEKLRRCGIRSLTPVVDVTNYVMLELGQPMHAFDLHKLQGGIRVRNAAQGESLELLDGKVVELDSDTLVIADHSQALAIAGVMGGNSSAVDGSSKDIFLESAFFVPQNIAGKARKYGLHTESSHRFERGVDFALQAEAIARATALILDICGGEPGPVTDIISDTDLPELPAIALRRERIARMLGVTLDDARVAEILSGLGCAVQASDDGWRVTPPTWRFDLRIEEDLIEELARVYGYNNIPSHSRSWSPEIKPIPERQVPLSRLKQRLTGLGYQEVITYSFIDEKTEALVNPAIKALALANPISSELAVMRTSLWGGLLQVVRHNLRRQQPAVRVFETGLVFLPGAAGLQQTSRIAGAITATAYNEQWAVPDRKADFFDIKGDVENMLQLCHLDYKVDWLPGNHPALHPGQSAVVMLDGEEIGQVGALHPELQQTLDIDDNVFLFDFARDALQQRDLPAFKSLSRFPALRRDLAILVDENVSYREIAAAIKSLNLDLIGGFQIFDVYNGEGVASGLKSIALSLILQDLSRTLGDEDVEHTVTAVLEKLKSDVGASLRD